MFGALQGAAGSLGKIQRLMQDPNFRAFIAHPKVQELFKDPEFRKVARSRDFMKITSYPKFASLLRDPEVGRLMATVNLRELWAPREPERR